MGKGRRRVLPFDSEHMLLFGSEPCVRGRSDAGTWRDSASIYRCEMNFILHF